jgi:hypothetical protein
MSLLSKLRAAQAAAQAPQRAHERDRGTAQLLRAQAGSSAPGPTPRKGRMSNGLKEFLWQLDDIGHGNLLDLGPVWQATVSFFIERGFKVYTEDLLSAWSAFVRGEEEQLHALPQGAEVPNQSAAARAERFLSSNLRHEPATFDAVLLWDLPDYLDRDAFFRIAARIANLMRDGGAILAVFHMRMPEQFHRYRVLDAHNFEMVPAASLVQPQQVYQNREMENLFEGFRSSKTFVGRDQLREAIYVK